MLKSPRRLPHRFNRSVSPQTRRLVERRSQHRRQYVLQRWQRAFQRMQRRAGNMRRLMARFATVSIVAVILLLVGLALFSPILHIREIRISRSDPRIDAETIQNSLSPLFGGHLFFLSTQEVSHLLEESVPDLRESHITKEYPSTLRIRVTLDPVIAHLVIENPTQQSPVTQSGAVATNTGAAVLPEGEDYLTNEGLYVVYNKSQVETGSGNILELRVVDWGARPEPWKPLIDTQFLDMMRAAESELKTQFGVTVKSRAIYVRAREFHLQAPQYSLWFDMRSPLPEQLQRYRLFLQMIGADKAKQYVDLRLKDKIVYK